MLGNGQFGEIQVGIWNCSPDEKCEVAIKTLNPETTKPDAKVKFLQEAVIIAQFRHPNVIGLHGTVGGGEPVRGYMHVCLAMQQWPNHHTTYAGDHTTYAGDHTTYAGDAGA